MEESVVMEFKRVQMCDNLNPRKFLASVSRMNEAGHRVVFDSPDLGSYIEDKKTGNKLDMTRYGNVFVVHAQVGSGPSTAVPAGHGPRSETSWDSADSAGHQIVCPSVEGQVVQQAGTTVDDDTVLADLVPKGVIRPATPSK